MSHFALQLMRQCRNVQPDLRHSPAEAHPGHLVLLSAHRKPVNPRKHYPINFFLLGSNINKSLSILFQLALCLNVSCFMLQDEFAS